MKVLIDHSVRQHAKMGEHVAVPTQDTVRGQLYTYLRFETRHRLPRSDWLRGEIETLSEVAELVRGGQVQAFTTAELHAEGFRAAKFPSPGHIDAFEGCQISELPPPFDRSKFGLDLDQFVSKEDAIGYCISFLLTPDLEQITKFIEGMKRNPRYSLNQFEEKCLRNASVFKELCRGIDETHYPDALHFWTAEEHGLDAFLTLDQKFRNVTERQRISMKCDVLYPSELVAKV